MSFKGLGPIKLGTVQRQYNFALNIFEFYVWFAGAPILIGREVL
jgi:hypothetical protein